MSPERLAAMQRGREMKRRERHHQGAVRVREYRRWLAAGSPKGRMPVIPSNADYRHAGVTR
jgi:hypothetical protein